MEYLSELLNKSPKDMTDEELEEAINKLNGMRKAKPTTATKKGGKKKSQFDSLVADLVAQTGLPAEEIRANLKGKGIK